MNKNHVKKLSLLFLIMFFVIGTPLYIYEKVEDKRQYHQFLDEFYHELDLTISSMDFVLSSEKDPASLHNPLWEVHHRLEKTGLLLSAASHFMNQNIRRQDYFFYNRPVQTFVEDGELDRYERRKIEDIREKLVIIKKELAREDHNGERKDLSVKEFNRILEKHIN